MSDKHLELHKAGVVKEDLPDSVKAALEALDGDEHKELARILKKVKDQVSDEDAAVASASFI
ncbi:MAG: hypothetical protein P8O91_09800 [Luminiphilus sp.]|nr:hypothetical protein [Luminiphilus sp.]